MVAKEHFNSVILAVVILLCLTSAPTIMALELGLKAGISASDQSYDYSQVNLNIDRLSQTGFAVGVFIGQNIGPLASVRLEVDYIRKGSAFEFLATSPQYPLGNGILRIEDQIDYLSFNLLATPSILKVPPISPYIIVGPRVDVLLSSDTFIEELASNDLESTVFGASIGVGVKFSAMPASLFVEAVYQPDFSDAFKIQTLTVRNNSFLITAGLLF